MKVLLDTCVWGGAVGEFEKNGHEVVWVGDWGKDPGDLEIMRHAYESCHVLVTLDKDFGELAIVKDEPHAGIVRLVGLAAREQGPACCR